MQETLIRYGGQRMSDHDKKIVRRMMGLIALNKSPSIADQAVYNNAKNPTSFQSGSQYAATMLSDRMADDWSRSLIDVAHRAVRLYCRGECREH